MSATLLVPAGCRGQVGQARVQGWHARPPMCRPPGRQCSPSMSARVNARDALGACRGGLCGACGHARGTPATRTRSTQTMLWVGSKLGLELGGRHCCAQLLCAGCGERTWPCSRAPLLACTRDHGLLRKQHDGGELRAGGCSARVRGGACRAPQAAMATEPGSAVRASRLHLHKHLHTHTSTHTLTHSQAAGSGGARMPFPAHTQGGPGTHMANF